MRASADLEGLIAAMAPYWAGEAEIVRAYFQSPKRTRESDLLWLARQARKEFWDGFDDENPGLFIGTLKRLLSLAETIDKDVDRHEILDLTEGLHAEFAHYCAFADAYDALRGEGTPRLNPLMLRDMTSWPENDALGELRSEHRRNHGAIGMRACRLTEGGYCALFTEGAKLAGKTMADAAIAKACGLVFDDEFGHMLKGIVGLDRENIPASDWATLKSLSIEQMRARFDMRNSQFGHPVTPARLAELRHGRIDPIAFDYARAGIAA